MGSDVEIEGISEAPLRVLESLLEGCQLIDRDYRYVYVNRAAATQGRTTPEALIGRRMTDAFPGIDTTEMFAALRRCMEERCPLEMENVFTFEDGTVGWFELRFRPVQAGAVILSLDLTPRRHAEVAVTRSRRALAVLSATNRTLIRARDAACFAEDVCKVTVGLGGYRLAWIGLCPSPGARTVQPLARAGFDDGFIDSLSVTREDSDRDVGPVGRALRSGRVAIAQRIAELEGFAPWREAALARGYGAVAALPISVDGVVVGTIAVYATEADSFDPGEIAVLEELALDVGHGFATLRAREELRRTTLEATESEERYRALFRHASVAIAHCRVLGDGPQPHDFVYLDANPAFERLTGCRDLAGRLGSQVPLHADATAHPWLGTLGRVARTREPVAFEDHLDAVGAWVEVSAYSPAPDHAVVVVTTVTARKQQEAALVRFSGQLERLTQVARDLSQARDSGTVIDIVRTAARELVAADGATLVLRAGDQCHYVHEDAIAPLWKGKRFPMAECISGWSMLHREPAVIEDVFADPRIPHDVYRATFVRSLVMVPIRSPDPMGAIGAYWATHRHATAEEVRILEALADAAGITFDNVRALEELATAEARARAIYDHMPSAQLVWMRASAGFALATANRAARALVAGSPVADAAVAEALTAAYPALASDLLDCARSGAIVRREISARLRGSTPRALSLTFGAMPDGCVVLHIDDVTDQRATEAQLQTAQRLEAIGRLAGGVAHDFNNLLSVILSYGGFVVEGLREGDPLRAEATEIVRAGERATALTRQLLAFSRKQVLAPTVVKLNDVVVGIERMLRRLLGADVRIEVALAADLGLTLADTGQLEQVLMNLAINARDAMPSGGHLTIATRNAAVSPTDVGGDLPAGRWVVLSVADTGTGIDPETLAHVFEPFFTTKAQGKGTGLGLSTVYGIASQSGGGVKVASRVGEGTTFSVYLPRVEGPVAVSEAPGPTRERVAGRESILIAEDDEAVRRLTERILRAAGYRVRSAQSAEELLQVLDSGAEAVDAVVTDVVMRGMSGAALAERLRRSHPDLAVLFMSGYPSDDFAARGGPTAAANFVGKPFTPEDLTRKLREALDRR